MGDAADSMINGEACEVCGCFFADGDEPGYSRSCKSCGGEGETL